MSDDINIEETLRKYGKHPSPYVKQSVLSRFADTSQGRGQVHGTAHFWKRPIPLYLAATAIIIAVGLSFFAGRSMPPERQSLEPLHKSLPKTSATSTQELKWEVAQSDLL